MSKILSDICRVQGGYAYKSRDFNQFGVPVVKIGDVTGGGTIDYKSMQCIPKSIADQTRRFATECGDSLISMTGANVGKVSRVIAGDPEARINQRVGRFIPIDPSRYSKNYIHYIVTSYQAFEYFSGAAYGSAQPNISAKLIENLPIPSIEPLASQAIGDLLASLDDKIENNRRMNKTLEAMAQAIFRDWFVDFGPTRRKATARKHGGVTDSVAIMGGLIRHPEKATQTAALFPDRFGDDGLPEGWKEEPLIDQANWVNGAAYKNMYFVERSTGLPVIKIAELKNGVTDQTKFTNTDLGRKYRIDDGELLFSWSGNPETSIDTFLWSGGPGWLNQHIFAVRPNGKHSKPLLFALLKYLKPEFTRIATDKQTTGLGHVTRGDMGRLTVNVASEEIYSAFNMIVEPIFERLNSAVFENITLAKTRDYLLPRLMSGEIRAAVLEAGSNA